MRPNVEENVKSAVKSKYASEAKTLAKTAAELAAKKVGSSYKGKMIGWAFVPIYGIIKVNQLKKEMESKAKAAAKSAAKKAASEYMTSSYVREGVKSTTKDAVNKVYAEKRVQIKESVKQACSDVIKKALADDKAWHISFAEIPNNDTVCKENILTESIVYVL